MVKTRFQKMLFKIMPCCYIRGQYNLKTDSICIYLNINRINSEGHKKANKAWRKSNKLIMDNLKINGCAICGYNRCNNALEFHHGNPKDKKYLISKERIQGKDLVDELNKCILLCANCHREIHNKERLNNE